MTPGQEKADKLIEDDKVFLKGETDTHAFYIVIGSKNDIYEVILNKLSKEFSCECKNLRYDRDCYHIRAVKILRGQNGHSDI